MLRKFHEAKPGGRARVVVWGTGRRGGSSSMSTISPDACVFLVRQYDELPHVVVLVST